MSEGSNKLRDGESLHGALGKIGRCFDMQSNEKNECFSHGLDPEKCRACVHWVSPGTAWMMLAAMAKTAIQPR